MPGSFLEEEAAVALRTAFTELFGLRHPIALAPMGGSAGGALTSAVSAAGGLGLVGGGNGDADWLARELAIAAGGARPWGVGFQSWAVGRDTVERALEYRPDAVMLSFGDPVPLAGPVRAAGARLIIQVTTLAEARQAADLGADVIVAQGTEAGGHGARHGWSTLPFVPVVADLAAPVPVLAAGGITDGRGVAAALALGAAGALVGTRFLATAEALLDPAAKKAIIDAGGEDTERDGVLDIARRSRWPREYSARTLRHPFHDAWQGREDELDASSQAKADYRRGVADGELPRLPVWAGQGVDLVTGMEPAAELVAALAAQAEGALTQALTGERKECHD
jgi:nitronate monooxygenase